MNEAKKQMKPKYVADAVCPKCFKPLEYPVVVEPELDRYKRELRTYYGWCFECDEGCLVIQFKRGERWAIHKYRPAVLEASVEQPDAVIDAFADLPALLGLR